MASSEHPPTIVITGASSGIGRAAAIELSRQGAEIAVVGRHPERTRAVAEAVNGTPFLADYDRLGDVRALAEALLEVLDNHAHYVRPRAPIAEMFSPETTARPVLTRTSQATRA